MGVVTSPDRGFLATVVGTLEDLPYFSAERQSQLLGRWYQRTFDLRPLHHDHQCGGRQLGFLGPLEWTGAGKAGALRRAGHSS
jgi:hypothetical protein